MAEKTGIAWTNSTFNPFIGCTKVSPGCANCYAERQNNHRKWAVWGLKGTRVRTSASNWQKPLAWNRKATITGKSVLRQP